MKLVQSLSLLLVLSQTVSALFEANSSSHLNFVIPQSLHLNGTNGTGYEHSVAHFGSHWNVHAMEGTMSHRLYYTNLSFCEEYSKQNKTETWTPPFILMIDRGDCTFVTKVRHAQKAGAAAVILADNQEAEQEPIVADDGSGHDISIPSVMMRKSDATTVKDTILNKHQPVVAELGWHWPKHETVASVEFWHTPVHTASAEFLTNFSKIANAVQDRMTFTPHYHILDGTALHCNGNADKEGDSCYQLCTNNGRYCAVGHHGVTGQSVVLESLRRLCIWKHYPGQPWWDYLGHFAEWCMAEDDEYFGDAACLADAYKHSGIDQDQIDTCMKDSGDVTADVPNSMLTATLETIEDYGIIQTPTVLVNEAPLRWEQLSPKSVFDTYCTGFLYGKAPHACYQCGASCGDPVACITRNPMQCFSDDGKEQEEIPDSGSSAPAKKKGHFWKWFFFLSLVGGVGGFVYYKKHVEDGDGGGAYTLADAFMSDSA